MNHRSIMSVVFFLCLFLKPCLEAKEKADYIIVGVGTAGAVLAKELSDDKNSSVIALHSGKNLNEDPDIKFTRNVLFTVFSALLGSSKYQTGLSVPQPAANDRELFWALALPEGGASAINAGAWCRGTNQLFAQWEAIAGPEWSVSQILDVYKSLEKYNGMTTDPSARGFNGPLNIRQNDAPTPLAIKFTQAVAAGTGVPIVLDYNDPNTPIGASSQLQYTQKGFNGELRVSSATAFLNANVVTPSGEGVDGRKLRVKFKSTALRTIWKKNKAIGVEYFQDGKIKKVYAKKGVIVCGGLKSSFFLMHSGIGPKEELESLGIKVKFNNPNVGQALADQPHVILAYETNPADTPISGGNKCNFETLPGNISVKSLERSYIFSIPNLPKISDQQRLLSSILCDGFEFPGNSIFAQISWLPAPGEDPTIRKLRLATVNPIPGLMVAIFDLVQPQSRGKITIDSFDPFAPPVIDVGAFTNQEDLNLYIQGFQTYIKNINTALAAIDPNYRLIFPNPAIIDDIELLTEFIKEEVGPNQHWQSHCRMAPFEQGGVVDSHGRVYGVQNLFVADNSIVPVGMDGSPMASAYLIAANIARLLRQ